MRPDAVAAWRRGERERLIALRLELSADERARRGERVLAGLEGELGMGGGIVSFYWPFRGEFDLRRWMTGQIEKGWRAALPVVEEKQRPMAFRLWQPGCRMERGIWNIPVPADGPSVVPDAVIAPLVGWDPGRYRLGYGGGYFDRTLAALDRRPKVIGIGLAATRLETIHPQPWDIPMDVIITD